MQDPSLSLRSVSPPSIWLVGFKDRVLESVFIEDLAVKSFYKLCLGYGVSIFIMLVIIADVFDSMPLNKLNGDITTDSATALSALASLVLGLSCSILVFNLRWFKRRRHWIFHVTGISYFLYVFCMALNFGWESATWKFAWGEGKRTGLLLFCSSAAA